MTTYLTIRPTPTAQVRRFDASAFASLFAEDDTIAVRETSSIERLARAAKSRVVSSRAFVAAVVDIAASRRNVPRGVARAVSA